MLGVQTSFLPSKLFEKGLVFRRDLLVRGVLILLLNRSELFSDLLNRKIDFLVLGL